jgi:DNA repair ATPase RecN
MPITFKKLNLTLAVSILSVSIFAFSNEQSNVQQDTQQTLQLLKNCEVVANYPMSKNMQSAYASLQTQEKKMTALASPIQAIEKQIQVYSSEIEAITKKAIQETDDTLHIDKKALAQQESVVNKLKLLMSTHQKDFDALGSQGNKIERVAKRFTDLVDEIIGDIKYDQIRITNSESKATLDNCQSTIYNKI